MSDYPLNLLRLVAEFDACDELRWTATKDGPLKFYLMCNDTFYWACADAEDVEESDLPALRQAYEDARAADRRFGAIYGGLLFIARKRSMRPQYACYPDREIAALWPLFDACGPDRTGESGCPGAHSARKAEGGSGQGGGGGPAAGGEGGQ